MTPRRAEFPNVNRVGRRRGVQRFSKREVMRHHYYRVREAVIAYLGGVCVKCGFADPRALQVDHIVPKNQGGGWKRHPTAEYKAVLEGESGYQLLCANCNWIKRAENNEVTRKAA